jgi:hypothetical protein
LSLWALSVSRSVVTRVGICGVDVWSLWAPSVSGGPPAEPLLCPIESISAALCEAAGLRPIWLFSLLIGLIPCPRRDAGTTRSNHGPQAAICSMHHEPLDIPKLTTAALIADALGGSQDARAYDHRMDWKTRLQTPDLAQRPRRRWMFLQSPECSGRSRHGMPAR